MLSPAPEMLCLEVPTYVGHQTPAAKTDYAEPNVPLVALFDAGLRIVLGTHNPDDLQPDILIERRPQGWAIFLHPLGGGDPCALVYFHDDGRSWLAKEGAGGPTPALVAVTDIPPEIDR